MSDNILPFHCTPFYGTYAKMEKNCFYFILFYDYFFVSFDFLNLFYYIFIFNFFMNYLISFHFMIFFMNYLI